GVDRSESEAGRLRQRLAGLTEKAERLAGEAQRLRQEIAEAEAAVGPLADDLAAAERARSTAEGALTGAEASLRTADAERHSWAARADALALALDEARARAGAERLAGVGGVLGTLLDLVEVDEGWEDAFEA